MSPDTTTTECLHVLGKKYSADILEATAEPKTATQLSKRIGIPHATCYRRLEQLSETAFLEEWEWGESNSNQQTTAYHRPFDELAITFGDSITIALKDD